ncbi:MAG: CBS domain-containing protein [Thermoplasmata archaeon]
MATEWPSAGDLMSTRPSTLPPDAALSQALGLMRSRGFHEIPILRQRKLIGMITFESIARRQNLRLATKVEHVMIIPPIVNAKTLYPELAEQLLGAGIRAAPVVGRRGELIGVVSRTDMVRALSGIPELANHRVEEVTSPASMLIPENERCGNLLAHVRSIEEHPLPVVDSKGRLVGAVGIADLTALWRPAIPGKRDFPQPGTISDVKVGAIMHSPPVTVTRGTTTGAAARLMSREKVSSAFLVEKGAPVGIVSQVDLLQLAVGANAGPDTNIEDVYVQISGLRGSGDPTILSEIDRVVARGLRHIARHVHPKLLSLHVAPHATHRTGDTTVEARLHTDGGIFYASHTGWNFYAGITEVMDELSEQARRTRDTRRGDRRTAKRLSPEEAFADPELEDRIRQASGDEEP